MQLQVNQRPSQPGSVGEGGAYLAVLGAAAGLLGNNLCVLALDIPAQSGCSTASCFPAGPAGAGILSLLPGRADPLLQEPGVVTDQHRVLVADAPDNEVPHVVADSACVPVRLAQQPLYSDRMRLTARSASNQPFLRSNGVIIPAVYSCLRTGVVRPETGLCGVWRVRSQGGGVVLVLDVRGGLRQHGEHACQMPHSRRQFEDTA